jgi:hypothetical protein
MKVTLAFPVIKKLKIEIALLPQRKPSSGKEGTTKRADDGSRQLVFTMCMNSVY